MAVSLVPFPNSKQSIVSSNKAVLTYNSKENKSMSPFRVSCKSPPAGKPQIFIFMLSGSFQKHVEHLKGERIFKRSSCQLTWPIFKQRE